MKCLQAKWKTIGSAGSHEGELWEQFQKVQNQFWEHIKLINEAKLLELSDDLSNLQDDFEIAKLHRQWNKVSSLSERIDKMHEQSFNLQDEISRLQKELGLESEN